MDPNDQPVVRTRDEGQSFEQRAEALQLQAATERAESGTFIPHDQQ